MGGGLDVECGCGDYDEQDFDLYYYATEDECRYTCTVKITNILEILTTKELLKLTDELEERYGELHEKVVISKTGINLTTTIKDKIMETVGSFGSPL